jgi:hypothetical protein
MAKHDYPDVDGWSVAYEERENGHQFTFTKADRKPVVIRGGSQTDPAVIYERGVRDVYLEDVRLSPPDDLAIWQERLAAAEKAVTKRKFLAGIDKGLHRKDPRYLLERGTAAGLTLAEINEIDAELRG